MPPGPARPRLSACVITLDEEARLPGCLASLHFCDEIVVVDSGSVDRTVELAQAAGATVVRNPWPGFAAQRNVALDAAAGPWVIEVDADERLEPALARGIERFLGDPALVGAYDMAMLPMNHRFLGRELSPAMQAPGYRARLFRRDAYRHDETRTVHEGLWPRGAAFPIDDGAMLHELAETWGEALADARAYARLEAAQFTGAVTPAGAVKGVVLRPVAKAAYRLSIDAGWRDGWQGIARIGLESATDACTWVHLLRAGRRAGPPGHFGSIDQRHGAPKVAAVTIGREESVAAVAWLRAAAVAGAEAVLVTAAEVPAVEGVRRRHVVGRGPLALTRAVNAEHQARPLDGLLVGGRSADARVRPSRAATAARIAPGDDPAALVARLEAARAAAAD